MTDFYTRIHKLVRARLFALSTLAARTDLHEPAAAASFAKVLDAELAWLDAHAHHEDTFVGPILARVAPGEAAVADAEHHALHAEAEALRAAFAALAGRAEDPRAAPDTTPATPADALVAYRALNRFVARHLAHLDHEETVLLPLLWARCPEEELAAAMGAFFASRTPAEGQADLVAMFPALAPGERAEILSGLRATLPPDAFATVAGLLWSAGAAPLA